MKFVLCSEGFYTPNTVEACVSLVGKPQDQISIGIINEAFAVKKGDKRWVIMNLNSVFNNFSAEIDIVDLLALSIVEIEERLADKDVIFVVGGDTDYLMSIYQQADAHAVPRDLQGEAWRRRCAWLQVAQGAGR